MFVAEEAKKSHVLGRGFWREPSLEGYEIDQASFRAAICSEVMELI